MKDMFNSHRIIDIRPFPMIPTWKNKRAGENFIGKILDRAMIKDNLMDLLGAPRSMVLVCDISDHMPISLSWNIGDMIKGSPFKFNCVWLEDKDYVELIRWM